MVSKRVLLSGVDIKDTKAMSGSTYIEFDNVEVPIENLIGEENQGFRIIMSSMTSHNIILYRRELILIFSRFQP